MIIAFQWASELAEDSGRLHTEEMKRREAFISIIGESKDLVGNVTVKKGGESFFKLSNIRPYIYWMLICGKKVCIL